jgi:predicted Zn-dependent peptidase
MKSQHNKLRALRIVIFILFFFGTTERIFSAQADRSVRPVGKPAPKVLLPKIQKTSLKNGLNVWLVEHHELPTVAMNIVFQSGAVYDKDMPGLAALTANLLDEGTATRDALQISEELESIGANLGVSSNCDGSNVSLFALKKHLDKAMGIFADVLLHPTFPQKEFERLKNTRLTSLTQQRDQPTAIANNAFNFILYGSEYPYGNNITGNEIAKKLESALQEWKQQQIASSLQSIVLYGLSENYLSNIEKVTLSDVQNISQKYVDTSTMVVVVVGDLSVIKDGVLALNLGDVVYCDVDGKADKISDIIFQFSL